MSSRTAVLSSLAAAALTVALIPGPAGATPAARDHDGDADSSAARSYTENDDTNDGGTPNNVADDGDNAHPSGRDRSVENGRSGNQGRSESDPDDDGRGPDRSNGGADKPNGPGGEDLADQDGNNGCGNDDDFEDDNEGWCGRPPKAEQAQPRGNAEDTGAAASRHRDDDDEDAALTYPAPAPNPPAGGGAVLPLTVPDRLDVPAADEVDGEVLGLAVEADETPRGEFSGAAGGAVSAAAPTADEDEGVLSSVLSVAGGAGALAFTGDHLLVLMTIAAAALVAGAVLLWRARKAAA